MDDSKVDISDSSKLEEDDDLDVKDNEDSPLLLCENRFTVITNVNLGVINELRRFGRAFLDIT
jgi:hypothetical protein